MKKISFITMSLFLVILKISSQNFVKNGNVELGSVPTLEDQLNYATYWEKTPSACGAPIASSPDLFDRNSTNCKIKLPANKWALNINSRIPTDNRYIGFSYIEPVRVQLSTFPSGCTDYSLSFWYHTIDGFLYNSWDCNPSVFPSFITPNLEAHLIKSSDCSSNLICSIPVSPNSNWQNYTINFSKLNMQQYDRLQFRLVYPGGYSKGDVIFIDDVELTPQALTPSIFGPSSICSGNPLTFNSTVIAGSPNNYYWEILEWDQLNNIPTPGGFVWSQWYAGYPGSSYTFPSNINLPCGRYYKVKLALQNACTVWSETNLFFNYKCSPVANAGPDQTVTCGCATIGTYQGPTKGTTFSWYNQSNNLVGSGQQITVCPGQTMLYTLIVSSSNGCTSTDQVLVTYNCAPRESGVTNVNENNELFDSFISLFPNPNNGKFIITNSLSEKISYQILDLQGRSIKSGVLKDEKTEIDLSNYDKGVYFLKCNINGKTVVKKVIVQ